MRTLVKRFIPQKIERYIRDVRDRYLRNVKVEKLPKEIFSKDLKYYKISFCTTCMNRLFHLKQTYLKNILDNSDYPNVEFVLIDYNSKDGLSDWARSNLKKYIDQGKVNYFKTSEPSYFHASKAKNLAHKLATGEILCNLDGDNFTGKDFAFYINYCVNKHGEDVLYHFSKKPFWGTEGRIVLSAKNFDVLGGYDEAFEPIGHEDHDLIHRAKAYGLPYHKIGVENFLRYLSNTTQEKAENCVTDGSNGDYYYLENENRNRSNENIKKGILIANSSGTEDKTVYRNFDEQKAIKVN